MAFETHSGMGYDVELAYTMDDGTSGKLDGDPVFEFDPAFGELNKEAFDPETGKQMFAVEHNGAVGPFVVTVRADGNLAAGEDQTKPIVWTDTFNMLAPDGAAVVAAVVGAERPTSP